MSTRWDGAEVAEGFDAYDDLPERRLGYPVVFSSLRLEDADVKRVLDYGCGPGKVAQRAAQLFHVQVEAVDSSAAMLAIAARKRPAPLIRYHLSHDNALSFLSAERVDAAMCCYVFINIGSLEQLRRIVAEVHRVLRPGGRFAILDTNPDTTGIQFSTFRSGDPGRTYSVGERRRVLLAQPAGDPLELIDFHWPKAVYYDLLNQAGFRDIQLLEPVLTAVQGQGAVAPLTAEADHPPFMVIVGEK
jgi:ubiquinone/menaquinone biosynthesis C-methylase UbiE